jgi:putative copper resistance protein D
MSFPMVGFLLLVVSLYGLYYSSLYELSLRNALVHEAIHAHFIAAGCLFFWPLLGVDRFPGELPHWARLMVLFITLPIHALLGLVILQDTKVIAGDYYAGVRPSWMHVSRLADQHTGGGLMWGTGETIAIVIFGILFVQWSRADARIARRTDRQLDREGRLRDRRALDLAADRAAALLLSPEAPPVPEDEQLAGLEEQYNRRLAALAARDVAVQAQQERVQAARQAARAGGGKPGRRAARQP